MPKVEIKGVWLEVYPKKVEFYLTRTTGAGIYGKIHWGKRPGGHYLAFCPHHLDYTAEERAAVILALGEYCKEHGIEGL